ncbi:Nop14-like protein [Hyphopichia burtonii NRRL Y-1933]|uniref:Nop14-like protein n=1 Tax=Hyphopichia burtonii NRRL Y-1933 TaxID=984485 RepID=A0A1E4RGU1_9ASCO|nr:Nop14-like protein [Hyphopichia burtonii NRRL Y-1933]ODV66470.1 Nop14-like protein [Hyphopichia burtonii NRRL Y-1933]
MAGSQLKQLKEALKNNGLVGQTNVKRKNKKSKTPHETRRANDDSKKILNGIRSQFNQFDSRINRNKHDFSIIQGGKFVKAGSIQHNQASKSKSNVEKNLKLEYEASKKQKGRTGGMRDRRFGENDKNMSAEEKMLARFTKERQSGSKKNVFSLGSDDDYSDDDDDAGFTLTHSGKTLNFDDEEGLGDTSKKYVDEDQLMPNEEEPNRKKSKNEVMKEIIAKSKFHKHQRQMEFEQAQENIMELDDEFGDVMSELNQTVSKTTSKPQFLTKTPEEIEYDRKMRELVYDRRSVPADRTKTEEEIKKEYEDKRKKLEEDRLRRMNGLDEERDVAGDDLDDDFWAGDDDEGEGVAIENSEDEEVEDEGSEESEEEEEGKRFGRTLPRTPTVSMPANEEELGEILNKLEESKQVNHIKKIVETYKPNLAEGNKDKMNQFVGILFKYILDKSEKSTGKDQSLIEQFIKLLKKLAETFNESLVEVVRQEINLIQERVLSSSLLKKDLISFIIMGYLFSTSDHYHLIITPALIVMNEYLTQHVLYNKSNPSISEIGQGLFIIDVLLNYESFSKRYIPEISNFLERVLLVLVPEPHKISNGNGLISTNKLYNKGSNLKATEKFAAFKETNITLSVSEIFSIDTEEHKFNLVIKTIYLIDRLVNLWREKSGLIEILQPLSIVLKHMLKYYANVLPNLITLSNKINKILVNIISERRPLTLQYHKALAIPTYAPKFEENFNPDKKSYDNNVERQEVNKMKSQLKKEKKSLIKDFRKQTKFNAREQIKEKKQMYQEYHKKMSDIVNTIQSLEGAERNKYERERKRR